MQDLGRGSTAQWDEESSFNVGVAITMHEVTGASKGGQGSWGGGLLEKWWAGICLVEMPKQRRGKRSGSTHNGGARLGRGPKPTWAVGASPSTGPRQDRRGEEQSEEDTPPLPPPQHMPGFHTASTQHGRAWGGRTRGAGLDLSTEDRTDRF